MKRNYLLIFRVTYWCGILGACVQALFPYVGGYLLTYSIIHMGLLVVFGLLNKGEDRQLAADRIQTAGYLHTLIGFSAAMILLNRTASSFQVILQPLGSALVTSIIGWLIGGEMKSAPKPDDPISLRSEAETLVREIRGFCAAIEGAHAKYSRSLSGLAEAIEGAHVRIVGVVSSLSDDASVFREELQRGRASMNDLAGLLGATKGSAEGIAEHAVAIQRNAKEASEGIKALSSSAKETARYLNDSRVLIAELEKLAEFIVRAKR